MEVRSATPRLTLGIHALMHRAPARFLLCRGIPLYPYTHNG